MTQNPNSLDNPRARKTELSAEAAAALEDIYRRVDKEVSGSGVECWQRGDCCNFEKVDHTLFASSLEVGYVKEKHPAPFPAGSILCPFWEEGLCVERERRPLGCRTYFCDGNYSRQLQAIYEKHHAEIRKLAERFELPYSYGPFVAALRTGNDPA